MLEHPAKGKNLKEVSQMPGVSDLQLKVRGPFAQALMAESEGDHTKAEERLARAILYEEQPNTT